MGQPAGVFDFLHTRLFPQQRRLRRPTLDKQAALIFFNSIPYRHGFTGVKALVIGGKTPKSPPARATATRKSSPRDVLPPHPFVTVPAETPRDHVTRLSLLPACKHWRLGDSVKSRG